MEEIIHPNLSERKFLNDFAIKTFGIDLDNKQIEPKEENSQKILKIDTETYICLKINTGSIIFMDMPSLKKGLL